MIIAVIEDAIAVIIDVMILYGQFYFGWWETWREIVDVPLLIDMIDIDVRKKETQDTSAFRSFK